MSSIAKRSKSSPTSNRPEVNYLTLSHVRDAAHVIVRETMTKEEPMPAWQGGVDQKKLEAALAAPKQGGFGKGDFYPELADKAAILLYSMVKNHAWTNGNKRMAMMSTMLFLALNMHWWEAQNQEVYAHVAWVGASDARCSEEVIAYLKKYFRLRIIPLERAGELARERAEAASGT